uniref:D-aminoacylase n=1 Tax=Roseihalotalea indica TaxID=2867963 RepID=A0AA49GTB5_9BACT|nr:D-aminoacylase [Tunicatimonas sp. TK19036]
MIRWIFTFLVLFYLSGCADPDQYDIIIRNGNIYDGTGNAPQVTDIGIIDEKIDTLGDLSNAKAETEIDATGLAVAPGFINMLSWAAYPLLEDGRSMSGIKQGVTLEVFGEGSSLGPLSEATKERMAEEGDEAHWTTFGEGLQYLVDQGVSTNVASFVGATTIRIHEIGYEDRAPTAEELARMQELVRQSMQEGALGLGSSLIYAPAFYASTDELVALAQAAAEYDGKYISHLRSEGDNFEQAVNELLTIATEANIPAEIYHLKAAGKRNLPKLDRVLEKIDSAQKAGLDISANMYNYVAASTGLDATMPPWVQEGGNQAWVKRLQDPAIRQRVIDEMESDTNEWENFLQLAGDADNILLVEFNQDSLNYLVGQTVGEIAEARGTSPAETIIDLVVQNGEDIGTVYFLMNEENVKKQIKLPYMSFGSDARSIAAEGKNLESSTHPRTYGNFARLLGKYVREEQVIPLEEAIHKLTWLSAQKLNIHERGKLAAGFYADIAIFDPATIQDKATFEEPHQYSEGMEYVLVNGTQVLKDGEHTGATPGMFVKGPGYQVADSAQVSLR